MSQVKRTRSWMWGALALLASPVIAATPTTTSSEPVPAVQPPTGQTAVTAAAQPAATGGKIFGQLDFRPSITATGNNLYTENSIEAGYSFSPTTRLTYLQAFDTNLADSTKEGLGLKVYNGFLRMRANNLLQSADKTLSLNFQGRLYVPTDAAERDKGYLTTVRTYLTLTKKLGALTLSVSEVPMLHAYTKAGVGNRANKGIFENMVVLSAGVQITKAVSLTVPVIYHLAKYQNYQAGAARNGAWVSNLWTWPELGIDLNDTHSIGVAYYSGNLVQENLGGTAISSGLDNGVGQVFWTVTL